MHRARVEHIPFFTAKWMEECTEQDIAHFYRYSDERSNKTCPLVRRRCEVLHETGSWLLKNYNGQFSNFVRSCGGSAVVLAQKVASELTSFNDIGVFPEVDQGTPSSPHEDTPAEYDTFLAMPMKSFTDILPDCDWNLKAVVETNSGFSLLISWISHAFPNLQAHP